MEQQITEEMPTTGSAREVNHVDFVLIRDNPIIRGGVFQYKGSQLPDADPNRIYNVYRPMEELTRPETLSSFVGLPIFDEHEMVGGKYLRGAEEKTAHGSILENIRAEGLDILAPIRIFSRTLIGLIEAGKKGLSLGYNCVFEKSAGVFNGIAYDYIQKNILGNHLAVVMQGRNGTEVLDSIDVYDHFDLALDNKESDMADEYKKDEVKSEAAEGEKKEAKDMIGVDDIHSWAKANMPKIKEFMALMGKEEAEEHADMALDADTKEKEGDQALDKDEDGKKSEEKEEKKEAMDSKDINALLDKRLGGIKSTLTKSIMNDVAARNALAKKLEPHIGTFACDSMDLNEVAAYGAEKLGIKVPKGHEETAITAFLQGKGSNTSVTYAMDSALTKPKAGGLLAKRTGKTA